MSSSLQDMSLHETGVPREQSPLMRKAVDKDRGCCHALLESSVVKCLKGEGKRPSLPEPKRPDVPLTHNQYELQECLPCVYKPLHYFVIDRLPFLGWFLQYNVQWLAADVIAGLTVGLMVVPQALAYAKIANLPLKYGLYTAIMGCFVYTLFGTSKDVSLGPTAILSLLTASLTESCNSNPNSNISYCEDCVPCAITLTLFTGVVQLILGLLSLGFLVDFIPLPIISGFTSAAAITIAVGQLQSLLGISHNVRRKFIYTVIDLFHYITESKAGDIVFGCLCIALVVFLKYFKVHIDNVKETREQTNTSKAALKFLWFFCTARNAVVVMIGALVGYTLTTQTWFSDQLSLIPTDKFPLPPVQPPNVTIQSIKEIHIGIAVAPFISFLESIAIAKAFARKDGYKVQPSQELVALGVANVVSSFFSSYPVTGSFSRTAVNNQSGVRTPAAGIITGSVVLLAIGLLSQYFHFIPKTALSAIIIAAVIPMVDIRIFYRIFKIRALDDIPLAIAFLFTLILGIEFGVPVAVMVYVAILLYRMARPRHQLKVYPGVVCVVFNGGWNYPGVEYIWGRITSEITTHSATEITNRTKTSLVILDCSAVPEIDYTIVQALKDECSDLKKQDIQCVLVCCQPQVLSIIERAAIENLLFRPSIDDAMSLVEGEVITLEMRFLPTQPNDLPDCVCYHSNMDRLPFIDNSTRVMELVPFDHPTQDTH